MENFRYNFVSLSAIQVSSFLSLPALMIGFILAQQFGLIPAISCILISNAILSMLALPVAMDAFKNRQTSAERVISIIGPFGAKATAFGLALVLSGWFAVNLDLLSSSILSLFEAESKTWLKPLLNGFIAFVITLIVLHGINRLKVIAKYVLPLFLIAVIFSFESAITTVGMKPITWNYNHLFPLGGIVLAIAAPFTMVFDTPTFYRFAESKKDGMMSIIISFFLLMSLTELLGAMFFMVTSEESIIAIFTKNHSFLILFVNACAIILGAVTVNNGNLYTAATNLSTLLPKVGYKLRVWWLAGASWLLSCFDLLNNLTQLLNAMLIVIATITSILVVDALGAGKKCQPAAVIAMVVSSIFGVISFLGFVEIINAAFIEAGLLSAALFIALSRFMGKNVYLNVLSRTNIFWFIKKNGKTL